MTQTQDLNRGLLYALSAFLLWGLAPIYFKAVVHVTPLEVLAHRVIWSVAILLVVITLRKQWPSIRGLNRKRLLPFLLSSIMITSNWFIFIWAVGQDRILETSLGYFINPLISVLLAFLFLNERLNKQQRIAVLLAAVGVLNQIWIVGNLPWIALALACTFGLYGLFRKVMPIDPVIGLFLETILLLPAALIYCFWLNENELLVFAHESFSTDMLLILAGFMTSIPLLFFAAGTLRLPLTTMGIVQYITPSMTFFMAILLYNEPFSWSQLITFACIWLGLIIFTVDGIKRRKRTSGKI